MKANTIASFWKHQLTPKPRLRPNTPIQPTPLRGPKIVAILKGGIGPTAFPIYGGGAAQCWPFGGNPSHLLPDAYLILIIRVNRGPGSPTLWYDWGHEHTNDHDHQRAD